MTVAPPLDMRAPEDVYTVFYVLFVVQLVIACGWLVRRSLRSRNALPLSVLAGALVVAYFTPPVYNHITLVWFPSNISFPYIEAFGMKDPSFDLMGYALFVGFGGYLAYDQIRNGGSARAIWLMAAGWGIADLLYELPFLQLDMYQYYGDQPFELGGFPLHWVFMNALVPVMTGALIHLLVERVRANELLVAAAAPPLGAALLFIPMLPVATTLNADVPSAVRWAAALLSMAVASWGISLVARYAASVAPAPARARGAGRIGSPRRAARA